MTNEQFEAYLGTDVAAYVACAETPKEIAAALVATLGGSQSDQDELEDFITEARGRVDSAIERSGATDTIVVLTDATPGEQKRLEYLAEVCTNANGVIETWGISQGREWRVHAKATRLDESGEWRVHVEGGGQ